MGLGLHGGALAVVKWLLKYKAQITITDIKTRSQLKTTLEKIKNLPRAHTINYSLGGHKMADFQNQDLIVQNPGVPPSSPYLVEARKNNIPIVNEAVLFFGLYPGWSIGVTGTRGKSTTATLIHKILKTEIKSNVVTGNIATHPMFEVLDKLKVKSLPVVELSSWHLENMGQYKVSPHIAVVTNVLVDHLNRYDSFSAYKKAKQNIVSNQLKNDIAVLNADNPHSYSFRKHTKAKVYFYSLKKKVKGVFVSKGAIYFSKGKGAELVMSISDIHLPGEHNISNILAAITVAKLVGIKNSNISKAIKRFRGVSYRLEYKGELNGMKIYNDSTSTTPDATIAAIDAFSDKNIILLAGGEDKELDYKVLAKKIKKQINFLLLLDGSGSDKLIKELKKIKFNKKQAVFKISSLKKAYQLAKAKSACNDIFLFSPAAASFNMFANEFDRAHQFDNLINGNKKKKKK